jgi:hypothetical protein
LFGFSKYEWNGVGHDGIHSIQTRIMFVEIFMQNKRRRKLDAYGDAGKCLL